MTDYQNLVIQPLNPTQDRTGFQRGVEALDRYFKKQAKQDIKRRIRRVFVATWSVIKLQSMPWLWMLLTTPPKDSTNSLGLPA